MIWSGSGWSATGPQPNHKQTHIMNYSDGSSIPKRKTDMPTRAVRVAAHSENASNDLKTTTQKAPTPKMPKTGFRGNGS